MTSWLVATPSPRGGVSPFRVVHGKDSGHATFVPLSIGRKSCPPLRRGDIGGPVRARGSCENPEEPPLTPPCFEWGEKSKRHGTSRCLPSREKAKRPAGRRGCPAPPLSGGPVERRTRRCRRMARAPAEREVRHGGGRQWANGSAGNATSRKSDSASLGLRPRTLDSASAATSRVASSAGSVLSRSRARSQALRARARRPR